MTYRCVSADSHIDMGWLPPNLFTSNASRALRDRMPYVEKSDDGPVWMTKQGRFGLACCVGPNGHRYVPGAIHRADRMASEGLYSKESQESRRLTDPALRVKDQDRDGVRAEVLYGILGAINKVNDPEVAAEMSRIYNDWLSDFCGTAPNRLYGLGLIPANDAEAGLKEARRIVKLGLKGVEMACSRDMIALVERRWDGLWSELAEAGVPVHFHLTATVMPANAPHWTEHEINSTYAVWVANVPFVTSHYLTSMILSGALDRHPDLKMVIAESGIGWIPMCWTGWTMNGRTGCALI